MDGKSRGSWLPRNLITTMGGGGGGYSLFVGAAYVEMYCSGLFVTSLAC